MIQILQHVGTICEALFSIYVLSEFIYNNVNVQSVTIPLAACIWAHYLKKALAQPMKNIFYTRTLEFKDTC